MGRCEPKRNQSIACVFMIVAAGCGLSDSIDDAVKRGNDMVHFAVKGAKDAAEGIDPFKIEERVDAELKLQELKSSSNHFFLKITDVHGVVRMEGVLNDDDWFWKDVTFPPPITKEVAGRPTRPPEPQPPAKPRSAAEVVALTAGGLRRYVEEKKNYDEKLLPEYESALRKWELLNRMASLEENTVVFDQQLLSAGYHRAVVRVKDPPAGGGWWIRGEYHKAGLPNPLKVFELSPGRESQFAIIVRVIQ